ncbi:MAG: hypothetical protein E6G67_12475 [Actinobacteria bacterium]|nr:MAG: hypothetical protein E6G67_12475 [Actinomycetota bacterium]
MAGKAQQILRARKEAKQKKMLFVLVPVFLLLLVWQGPKTYKAVMGGSSPPPATPASTGPTTTVPGASGPNPSTAPAPSTESPVLGTATTAASGLPNTDPTAPAATGQLLAFSLFSGKNPFLNSGAPPQTGTSDTTGSTTGSSTQTSGTTTTTTTSSGQPSGGQTLAGANVSVNGASQAIRVGAAFPRSNPLFRLVSVSAGSVKIGLVSGRFLNGSATQKLAVGKSLTLVSQPGGLSYKIVLLSLS